MNEIKEQISDEIEPDAMSLDDLISELQTIKSRPENVKFTRLVIDGETDFESYWATIKVIGCRSETEEETESRLRQERGSEYAQSKRRFAEYLKLKEEFGP